MYPTTRTALLVTHDRMTDEYRRADRDRRWRAAADEQNAARSPAVADHRSVRFATLRRLLGALLACLAGQCASLAGAAVQAPVAVMGRSWLVADLSSGQILASERADERSEPASLTKLMTAYLVFGALRQYLLSVKGATSRKA